MCLLSAGYRFSRADPRRLGLRLLRLGRLEVARDCGCPDRKPVSVNCVAFLGVSDCLLLSHICLVCSVRSQSKVSFNFMFRRSHEISRIGFACLAVREYLFRLMLRIPCMCSGSRSTNAPLRARVPPSPISRDVRISTLRNAFNISKASLRKRVSLT